VFACAERGQHQFTMIGNFHCDGDDVDTWIVNQIFAVSIARLHAKSFGGSVCLCLAA